MGSNPGGLKMKRIYKKEEGVSPVIATILMVAITVVLAATVWLLVSGYMGGSTQPNLTASLTYDVQTSNPTAGYVNISVAMSSPSSADFTKVIIGINGTYPTGKYLSADGTGTITINSVTYNVKVIDYDGNGKLSTGDVIYIYGHNLNGATISLAISGYSGSQQITIP